MKNNSAENIYQRLAKLGISLEDSKTLIKESSGLCGFLSGRKYSLEHNLRFLEEMRELLHQEEYKIFEDQLLDQAIDYLLEDKRMPSPQGPHYFQERWADDSRMY